MLPFLWAVNAVWFAKEAFSAPHYDEQKEIRRCKSPHSITLYKKLIAIVFFSYNQPIF